MFACVLGGGRKAFTLRLNCECKGRPISMCTKEIGVGAKLNGYIKVSTCVLVWGRGDTEKGPLHQSSVYHAVLKWKIEC